MSYYGHTILAYPALMGGYEYTPINLNKRDTVLMKDKHNEALLLLPLIFKNQGWQATVTDAPWGDYSDVTPSKMFVDRGVKYEKLKGKLGKFYKSKYLKPDKSVANILCRNMLYFSFMKVAPAALKNFVYNDGNYLNVNTSSTKNGLTSYLLEGYAGLFYLPELTDFSSKNLLLLLSIMSLHTRNLFWNIHHISLLITQTPVNRLIQTVIHLCTIILMLQLCY